VELLPPVQLVLTFPLHMVHSKVKFIILFN
jgi:hypothetical protein